MKVLVAYLTVSGNTKKVAEAIYGEISCEKEIKPIKGVNDLSGYDLSFLGFPTHMYGPNKKEEEMIKRLCTNGRNVAMFVTHGSPEDGEMVDQWMGKFKSAASGANLVGFFDCQGQLSGFVKFVMRISRNKNLRKWAKMDNSQGQPDQARIDRAKAFARETLARMN